MEYTTLGRTGIRVSRLGFGCAAAGISNYLEPYRPTDAANQERFEAAVARAIQVGVNYFDTAQLYGAGLSEEMLGRALRWHPPVVIATKIPLDVGSAREALQRSRDRLGVDVLDVVQLHGTHFRSEEVDRIVQPGGLRDQLEQLRSEGVIRFIGVSTEGISGATERLIAEADVDVVQLCYNVCHQHPYDPTRRAGLMYDLERDRRGVVVMRSLTSGLMQRWMATIGLAEEARSHIERHLLNFVLSNPMVDVALVGMRSPAEVDANHRVLIDLPRIDLSAIHERFVPAPNEPANR